MLSWQSRRVDFDDSEGKKDLNVVIVVAGVVVVGVFVEREASGNAILHIRKDKRTNN